MYINDEFLNEQRLLDAENKHGLATFDLERAVEAEKSTYGEEGGEVSKIAAWLDAYLDARLQFGHRRSLAMVHEAIKISSPYAQFPELKPHEYGDMLRDVTAYVGDVGKLFWEGDMEEYQPENPQSVPESVVA